MDERLGVEGILQRVARLVDILSGYDGWCPKVERERESSHGSSVTIVKFGVERKQLSPDSFALRIKEEKILGYVPGIWEGRGRSLR